MPWKDRRYITLILNFSLQFSSPYNIRRDFGRNQKLKYLYLRLRTLFLSIVFHHIKNQVRGLCVGGYISILIFGSFQNHGGYCTDPNFQTENKRSWLADHEAIKKSTSCTRIIRNGENWRISQKREFFPKKKSRKSDGYYRSIPCVSKC